VLSVSAAVGFITLLGVAVMDGVLLITYIRQARERYGVESQQPILEAVSQRLRPVLMTAMLASLGLLPAALSHAIGSDTQRPFAIVIIGGLISSTLLTLLLLPTLYDLFEHWFGSGRAARRRRRLGLPPQSNPPAAAGGASS
jgi:cobalt-zinc-cadmium resistance protein CzcA